MSDDVIALLGLVEENQRTMKDNQAAEPTEKAAAEQRMKAGKPSGNLPGGDSRDKVAAYTSKSAMMGLLRSFERQNETLEKFLLALPNGRSDWQFDIERHPGGTIKAVKAKRENEVMN